MTFHNRDTNESLDERPTVNSDIPEATSEFTIPYNFDAPLSYRTLPIGLTEDGARKVHLDFWGSSTIVGSSNGQLRTRLIDSLLTGTTRLPQVALLGIAAEESIFQPWSNRFTKIASDANDIDGVLLRANAVLDYRAQLFAQRNRRFTWFDMRTMPRIAIIIEDLADLVQTKIEPDDDAVLERLRLVRRLVLQGAPVGITTLAATSSAPHVIRASMGSFDQRLVLNTAGPGFTDALLGDGMTAMGAYAHEIPHREFGLAFLTDKRQTDPKPARIGTYELDRSEIQRLVSNYASHRVSLNWFDRPLNDMAFEDYVTR